VVEQVRHDGMEKQLMYDEAGLGPIIQETTFCLRKRNPTLNL
jgi:hypothetical protein